ncbi:response regulator [Cohnella abietis]|uniref:AraC family transcriptional regulator n=1 Tax=Cohnella abietis TaxID=2507935 RepID=A0A3T1CZH3_9BACL|nr:response regulator [Cohnella abietis]BBI31169.1 hypothetical protein KCTCHS21_05680 [Cohnella abietis]
MASVLIVDDEPIICGAVSRFLLRSDIGIDRVETALNGFEALDYLRLEPFDLVITDIQMGGMNGIELMEIIFSEHPDLPVIVISAHEDFQYAQQALRLGAHDYLIKPVESEHLCQIVGSLLQRRHMQKAREWESTIRHKYAFEQLITTKTVLLNEWLTDEADWEEEESKAVLDDLELSLPGPYFCVWSVEIDLDVAEEIRNTRFKVKDRRLLLFAALNLLEESLSNWEALSFYAQGGHLVTIFSVSEEEMRQWGGDELRQMHLIARTVYTNLTQYLRLKGSIGISHTERGISRIPKLYRETKEALESRKVANDSLPVYYIGDIERSADKLMHVWQKRLEGLVKDLRQCSEPHEAEIVTDELLAELEKLGMPEDRRASCLLQAAYCVYGLLDVRLDSHEEGRQVPEPQSIASAVTTRERLPEVRDYFRSAVEAVIRGHLQREHSTMKRAIEYLKRHYSNKGLKLQDVAREVHLSPNYFSYLFKKTTDKNLWDYLTELRMEEAKKLLLGSDLKRYEIAEMIGYEAPEHFSRVFKKFYGVSPADYRK